MTNQVRKIFCFEEPSEEAWKILREADQCCQNVLPFDAHGKQWRVTNIHVSGRDLIIEGVEFEEFEQDRE